MAGALKESQLARHIYNLLQSVSCPLVEGLFLQEEESMLQLLCAPSQHRTDILAWICNRINPNFLKSVRSKDPDTLTKEMALFGQELTLCKSTDLDLIRGVDSPLRQLEFMQQLLALVSGSSQTELRYEDLLNELFSPESLPHLSHLLRPVLQPWPAHIKALHKGTKSSKPKDEADVSALLKSTQAALEQLQTECDFLADPQVAGSISSSAWRVACGDLLQLMSAFSHVYEMDLKSCCNREAPDLRQESNVFSRVHQALLNCNTELEILSEISEASDSVTDSVKKLQTQPEFWMSGRKVTLPEQLEELNKRYKDFLSLLHN